MGDDAVVWDYREVNSVLHRVLCTGLRQGCYWKGANQSHQKLHGLRQWCPSSSPPSSLQHIHDLMLCGKMLQEDGQTQVERSIADVSEVVFFPHRLQSQLVFALQIFILTKHWLHQVTLNDKEMPEKWRKWKHSNTDWPKMRGSIQTQWTGWGRRWRNEGESGGIGRKDGLDEWSGLWRFRCGTPQLSLEHAAEYGEWEEKWQTRNYRLWKKGWVGSEE